MKNLKGLVALVLALSLTMTLVGAAFADDPAANSITLAGLESGDKITYYKVIEWVDSDVGWRFVAPFASALTDAEKKEVIGSVAVNPDTGAKSVVAGKITQTVAKKISDAVTTSVAIDGGTVAAGSTSWTKTGLDKGLYMVQAVAATAEVIYNPAFLAVQADASGTNLDASTSTYSDAGMVKKSTVTVDKKAKSQGGSWDEWTTEDVGDIIDFKIEVDVPVYLENYTNPVFTVSDTMSAGLSRKLGDGDTLGTIKVGTSDGGNQLAVGTDYTLTTNLEKSFVITFTNSYLQTSRTAGNKVYITYQAKITTDAKNVNPEDNTVTIEYSRDPENASDHGTKQDKTTHYTFSIDAGLQGNETYTTSEIIKVSVDEAGNPITEEKTYSNTTKHHPLAGATFELFTNEECTTHYSNASIAADKVWTTGEYGLLNISGLDEGTYWLKEKSAPSGYVTSTTPVKFTITAEYDTVAATASCNAYKVLKGYKVKVNDTEESSYTFNAGTKEITVTGGVAGDVSHEIKNVKGLELPSTGGIGTTIFYIAGIVMVLGAAAILVARRKSEQE